MADNHNTNENTISTAEEISEESNQKNELKTIEIQDSNIFSSEEINETKEEAKEEETNQEEIIPELKDTEIMTLVPYGAVIVFTRKAFAGFCMLATKCLKEHGVTIKVIDTSLSRYTDETMIEELNKATGSRDYPKIVIGDYYLGGYNDLMLAIENKTFFRLLDLNKISYGKRTSRRFRF